MFIYSLAMIIIPILFISIFIAYFTDLSMRVFLAMIGLSSAIVIASGAMAVEFMIIPFLMIAAALWLSFKGGV